MQFLASATKAWPTADAPTRLVTVSPAETRVSIYDNALVALVLERAGRHEEAGHVLESLATLQRADGAIAFSFQLSRAAQAAPLVRSGALAWVGYSAVEYLDGSPGGPAREAVVRMAHRLAAYLSRHTVRASGDPRDGLVTGGEGDLVYESGPHGIEETFVPGEIPWVSVEHNVDAFFFLRALGRLTGQSSYAKAAEDIAGALAARAWDGDAGQLRRGLSARGVDATLALDCASWGSLFLLAADARTRAETAFAAADGRFASRDPKTGIAGHRPYVRGPVLEDTALSDYYVPRGVPSDWSALEAVWPEGSAGVALAALRLGHRERARAIVTELERLRDPSGGLPMMTAPVPFEFDTDPSVAATAWLELLRAELDVPGAPPFVWAP